MLKADTLRLEIEKHFCFVLGRTPITRPEKHIGLPVYFFKDILHFLKNVEQGAACRGVFLSGNDSMSLGPG
jgi:hypothetical protein